MLLLDVIPLSLGLETMGGVVEKLIPRNTTIPTAAAQIFTTFEDDQNGFDIHVVQGERELVDRLPLAGALPAQGHPADARGHGAPRGDASRSTPTASSRVSAKEQTTGVEPAIEVKPSYGLTDEEIERMLLDSFEHAEEDVQRAAAARAARRGGAHPRRRARSSCASQRGPPRRRASAPPWRRPWPRVEAMRRDRHRLPGRSRTPSARSTSSPSRSSSG